MILHDRNHLIAGEVAIEKPAGNLVVPNQRVSADLHVVDHRKTDEGIGIRKVKAVVGRLSSVELESILANQQVEFATQCLAVKRFISKG